MDSIYFMNEERKLFSLTQNNYAGNSYTYHIFKILTKILLTEVYLYRYQGRILTYK